MGKPIYTIHQLGIWKYDPKTNQTTRLVGKSWRLGVDRQLVKLIVSYIRAKDERSKIQDRIEAAKTSYSNARTSRKRKSAASKLEKIQKDLEEVNLVKLNVQKKLAQLRTRFQKPSQEQVVAARWETQGK